jgi:hypothetical protein
MVVEAEGDGLMILIFGLGPGGLFIFMTSTRFLIHFVGASFDPSRGTGCYSVAKATHTA